MDFTPDTYRLIRSWMHGHVQFVREVVKRLQAVSKGPIGQPFSSDFEEYIINNDGVGYHVEYDADMNEGTLKFVAVPGRFVPSNIGPMWVNERTRLHDEIERKCDQQEGSLIIQ